MKIIWDTEMGNKSGLRPFWHLIFSKLCELICFWLVRNRINYFFLFVVNFFSFFNNMKILKDSRMIFGIYVWNICHWIIFHFHLHRINLNVFIPIITICTWEWHKYSYFARQTMKFAYYWKKCILCCYLNKWPSKK